MLWGLGQLGVRPDQLLITVSLRLQQPGVLAAFSPRQLAMAAYAFATLDFFPGGWAVPQRRGHVWAAAGQQRSLRPQSLATHAPTYAPHHTPTPTGQDCVDLLADAALASRQRLEPRALSHVLWNMSRLGYVDDPFFLAFVPGT